MTPLESKRAGYERGKLGLRAERGSRPYRFAYVLGWSQGWREYLATLPPRDVMAFWREK